jgi:hypothetical protein
VSDQERDQQADDAKEDLEMTDEDADQVRGGLISKAPKWESADQTKEKW